ncbi:hypothetical protein MaudCBS49596_008030 [Microsporum audouinii]
MVPESKTPAYQALLALEKGISSSPIEQLIEAARVTGIDLESYRGQTSISDSELPPVTSALSAPKEEWVLRWLLKKLKGSTDEPNEYRNNKRAWILLRALFRRIPIRSLAFTLNENDFLSILRDSLVAFDWASSQETNSLKVDYSSKAGAQLKRIPESDSSTRSRKRKRTDASNVDTPKDESTHDSQCDDFLAILESVNTLLKLADQLPQSKLSLKAQLKLIFRGEAKTSAVILGMSCSHAQTAVNRVNITSAASFTQRLYVSLIPVLEIWELRSDHFENGSTSSSNEVFVSHALVGVLGLIKTIRQYPGSPELVNGLERLVALHTILNLREAYFSSEAVTSSSESNLKKVRHLSNEFKLRLGPVLSSADASILPTLFDISIRAMPRNNFRRQLHETPWLESFAICLMSQAGYPLNEDQVTGSVTEGVHWLQEFLDVAIHRNLKLSLGVLVQIASRYSGLSNAQNGIEWHLIARIVQLDVDVFLLNSGIEQSAVLLNSLLRGITILSLQKCPASSEIHNVIKREIVIPLARGFFNARDGSAFIRIWTEQLSQIESARQTDEKNLLISIWEDDEVVKACGGCLAVSGAQLDTQVVDILGKAQPIKSSLPESSSAYSYLVVLDSILMSPIKGGLDTISAVHYEQTFEKLFTLLSSSLPRVYWRWRVWRCIQNSVSRYPDCSEAIQFDIKGSLVPMALRKLELFAQSCSSISPQDCLETFMSLGFLICLCNKALGDSFNEYINGATSAFLQNFKPLLRSGSTAWDGRMETLSTPAAVSIACGAALLSNSSIMARLPPNTRQLLFTGIISSLEVGPASTIKSQLSEIWKDFLSSRSTLELSSIVDDLVNVIYDKLTKNGAPSKLLISSLLYTPTRLIPRSQRGSIADLLQSFFLDGKVKSEMKLDALLLMTRLVEVSRLSAQITSDEDKIWEISRSVNVDSEDNAQLLFDAFKKFHGVIISRFEAAPGDSVTKFIKNLYSRATKSVPRSYRTMEYPLFILSLSLLYKHGQKLDSKEKFEIICALRQKTFNDLISDLHSLAKTIKKGFGEPDTVNLAGTLCMLDTFPDLQHESKDLRKKIRKIEEYMSKYNSPEHLKKQARLLSVTSKAPGADIESRLHDCMALFPLEQLHGRDQRTLIQKINIQVLEMGEDAVVQLIHNICEAELLEGKNGYRLLLLGMAIVSLDPIQDRESLVSRELSTAFTKISVAFSHTASIESFCLAAESLDTILRSQSRSVTQWNIDNLLANISLILSPSGPLIDIKFAGTIHSRLCKLLGTLFGLYRQKLSGRFHLVLPIMQALLRCLFTRNKKTSGSSGAGLALPAWVIGSFGLKAEHGTRFARLLSALCDPTVSSVQRHGGAHSRQALNDNTKKMRSLAGQYLQYLVMEYSSCQLKGHISPEMKAALMPGMYVVLDVMSQSTMRAMNAGMDSSSRAVFKTLYDDYIRFGKWDHN